MHRFQTVGSQPGDFEQGHKDHHSYPIVKKGFANYLGFQFFGDSGLFKDRQDRNGICWRNQGAKQQAVKEWYLEAKKYQSVIKHATYQKSCANHSQGGKNYYRPALGPESFKIGVKGPGKEHKTQEDIQEQVPEIYLGYYKPLRVKQGIIEITDPENYHGEQDGDQHEAYSVGEFQETDVDIAEEGGKDDHDCSY